MDAKLQSSLHYAEDGDLFWELSKRINSECGKINRQRIVTSNTAQIKIGPVKSPSGEEYIFVQTKKSWQTLNLHSLNEAKELVKLLSTIIVLKENGSFMSDKIKCPDCEKIIYIDDKYCSYCMRGTVFSVVENTK